MVGVCMRSMFQANTGHCFGRISFYPFFIIMVWVCSACLHSLRKKRSKGLHPFSGSHGVCVSTAALCSRAFPEMRRRLRVYTS